MTEQVIKVVGLNEFRRGLRGLDSALPKAVRTTLNSVVELFIGFVRPKVPSVSGAARASLRPQSTQSAAKIAAGGPRAPYYAWLDFGGRVGRRKQTKRPVIAGGRYIFPTLGEHRADIEGAMLKGMIELAARNGMDVDG